LQSRGLVGPLGYFENGVAGSRDLIDSSYNMIVFRRTAPSSMRAMIFMSSRPAAVPAAANRGNEKSLTMSMICIRVF
jgi:hypothetical protein